MSGRQLDVVCRITIPGGWLTVTSGPYSLTPESFTTTGTTWRRKDVTNPFVEGTWTVDALRDNQTETIDIFVSSETGSLLEDAVEAVVDALSQLNFAIEITFEGVKRTYTCWVADVIVKADQPLRFATMAQITAQVPRHPAYTREDV